MSSRLLPADDQGLRAAIAALERGRPVVVPTDTVYGLAVRAGDADALDRVFALKQRPAERSIAVLVADAAQAETLAALNQHERRVIERCWPGALTLILQRRPDAAQTIGRPDGTVGLRCPNNAFIRKLAQAVGPIATTSANISGQRTPIEASEAEAVLDGPVDVIIDGGRCEGMASTVARLDDRGGVSVLREGEYSQRDLERLLHSKR